MTAAKVMKQVTFEDLVSAKEAEVITGTMPTAKEAEDITGTMPNTISVNDFPVGTRLKLDSKKYLWAVMGHIGLEVPVDTWDEFYSLIDAWYTLQIDWEKQLEDELAEVYQRIGQKYGDDDKPSKRADYNVEGKAKAMRGLAISLGKQKGVYVIGRYPNLGQMSTQELGEALDYLKSLPDKGGSTEGSAPPAQTEYERADQEATARTRVARLSRR